MEPAQNALAHKHGPAYPQTYPDGALSALRGGHVVWGRVGLAGSPRRAGGRGGVPLITNL